MLGYGDVPLFKGIFLKKAELSVTLFEYVQNYGYRSRKHAELWALFWTNVAKIYKICKGFTKDMQRICKSYLLILSRFAEVSLHCRNMGISFHHLWVGRIF